MQIHRIEIGSHRIIQNAKVDLLDGISHRALKDLYGDMAITLVAGRNGSGKTSLLSFVAQVFHQLERSPKNIRGIFSIEYSLDCEEGASIRCKLYRQAVGESIRIGVAGQFDKAIISRTPKSGKLRDGEVLYEDIKRYLPENVIVSAFSLSGEYPNERMFNFNGDRRLKVFDVSKLYGHNHFGFPSLSSSLSRLMEQWLKDPGAVKVLEDVLGIKLTGQVLIRMRDGAFDDDDSSEWFTVTPDILADERAGAIYINDISMTGLDGRELTLRTLSSGQKFLFVRIVTILGAIQRNSLVLIEEPEMHLDPTWSRQLISLLVSFFKGYKAHFLIATHSFSLLNSVPSSWVLVADHGTFAPARHNTLLANESALAGMLYAADSHLVEERVRKYIQRASVNQLLALFEILGESSARYDVFRRIKEEVGRNA